MAIVANPNMTKRNLIWLMLIAAIGVIVGLTAGLIPGLVAGAVVLAMSEVVERARRTQRQRASTTVDP